MSVIGLDTIIKRIQEDNLIENIGDRDMNNPEGCGVDFRLGSAHKIIRGEAYIEADRKGGQGLRKGVETEEVSLFQEGKDPQDYLTVKPHEYYLVQTIESVNIPSDLMPIVFPRSSLFRAGLLLLTTKTDPGYKGTFTFGLVNLSSFDVRIQMGARICNVVFLEIEGKTVDYRGQHQRGRITPENEEKQV